MRKYALLATVIATTAACGGERGKTGGVEQGERDEAAVAPDQARAIASLEAETGRTWKVLVAGAAQLPMHVSGSRDGAAADPSAARRAPLDPHAATVSFLERNKALFKIRDPRASLRLAKSQTDSLGMTHARFQQTTHGIPVSGAEMTAHYDLAARITSIDSTFVAGVDEIDVQPAIDAASTLAIVKADALARQVGADEAKLEASKPSLVVFAREGREPRLAWKTVVRAVYGSDPHRWVTTNDAKTGAILERYDNLQHAAGSGIGVLGDTKKLEVTAQGTGYILSDTSRGVTITTYTSAAKDVQVNSGSVVVKSNSATSWDTVGVGRGAAVDAHFYAGVVYDHYKKIHGRNGLDGNGGPMLSSVHYSVAFQNSFWDGTSMTYGDGADGGKAESAGLDVVGHEFTHGVTEATSGLEYLAQSGALNESVSDIFAVFIEHGAKPDDVKNWIMFEDVGNGFRDMKDPTKYEQPANMSQYVNTQQDNGGVHINSGIPNNAMALMTVGGTNVASKINVPFGLGWEKSEKLWFRAATMYFQERTSFAQAAQALMQAGQDIALTENEQNIVDCSLKAVGMVPGACKTIIDPTAKVPAPHDPDTTPPAESPQGGQTQAPPLPKGGAEDGAQTPAPEQSGDEVTQRQTTTGCNLGARSNGLGSFGAMLLAAMGVLVYRRKRA